MLQLNYHHLYYFYTTAKEGSIRRAAEKLHLTPQTISGQISAFENYLGEPLFERQGKRLVLNNRGKLAYQYADDIFALGNELVQALNDKNSQKTQSFTIGVTDVVPKVFAFDLVQPVMKAIGSTRLIYKEGDLATLLSELAINKIDLILSDVPLPNGSNVKAFNHFLGESGTSFFAIPSLAQQLAADFPQCLDGQPLLIPSDHATIKAGLLAWFEQLAIQPQIIAEFDDSALMKLFGQEGFGVFCAPTSIQSHICSQYKVDLIGSTHSVSERFYAISPERKIKHELALEIIKSAGDLI